MKFKVFVYGYILFGYFVYQNCAQSAERSIPKPTYSYGMSDAYDKANENNAHYREARPASSFNRSTEERTQLQRSTDKQRERKAELKHEERNSYKQQ